MKLISRMTCLLVAATGVQLASAGTPQPNIMFVMSDDHTSQAVGVYGGRLQSLNPTPVIDSLAKEGIIMKNAFCQNGICTPSRAAIMTGQSSAVNGVTDLWGKLPEEQQYLAHEMKKAGYQTAVVGKWHLKERPSAFDYYKVVDNQGFYFDPVFYETGATDTITRLRQGPKGAWKQTFKNAVEMKGHSSDCIADSALTWFKEKRDPDKPFFLKLHFKAPHDMFDNALRYDTYLEDTFIPEPENLWERGNHGSIATRGHNDELLPYIGTSIGERNPRRNYAMLWGTGEGLTPKERKAKAYQTYLKKYLRCVKGVDDNLGRVIAYMKEAGLYDNTVIIYTGDQGFFLGEHDFMDKRWAYEEGQRMPFIVRYPKTIKPGSTSDAIVENIDYPAMMLDYAGVETPDYMHGRSFRSIMETGEEPEDWKKSAYYHYWMHLAHHDNPGHLAIRTKRYKLIYFYGCEEEATEAQTPPGWELYDLEKDPKEMNNLYDNPEYAQIIEELKEELKTVRGELGEDDPKFACNKVIDEFWEYGDDARAKAIQISAAWRAEKDAELQKRLNKKAREANKQK